MAGTLKTIGNINPGVQTAQVSAYVKEGHYSFSGFAISCFCVEIGQPVLTVSVRNGWSIGLWQNISGRPNVKLAAKLTGSEVWKGKPETKANRFHGKEAN